MTLLFMDGMDHFGSTADLSDKYASIFATNVAYNASAGRFGGGCIRVSQDDKFFSIGHTDSATMFYQFAFKSEVGTTFGVDQFLLFLSTVSTSGGIKTTATGQLTYFRGASSNQVTSTETLSKGVYQYIEVQYFIDNTVGRVIVKVDGVTFIDFTGDTKEGTIATVDSVKFFGPSTSNDHDYDDIIIMNNSGSVNNALLGDTKIETIYPTGDTAQKDFTPTGAGTTNADRVDDGDAGPDDDTTYVESSTVGHEDHYAMGNLASSVSAIHAVQAVTYAKKDDAGSRTARQVIDSNGTKAFGASLGLGTSYTYHLDVYELNPNTSTAWTKTTVDAVLLGQEVET